MKDKPVSHKNKNTFHFLTFSERISKINIDVIHKIPASLEEDNVPFFFQAVEKWTDLNYSQDYGDLQKEIGTEIRNLNQIAFRQDEIIEILLKYLGKEGSLALDAVLELIVALAKDLQHFFYPHFPKFFSAIVLHLSSKDAELLEKLFMCLAYLFKVLWKYMLKDIENVYRLFSSLLSSENKEHIRIFAVESFAFLIRKVQKRKELFSFIFQELQKNPTQSSGVGQLFFEVVKGVKEQFHSCTEGVLKLLFEFLGNEKFSGDLIEEALLQCVTSMAKHTLKKYCLIIQNTFCDVIEKLLDGIREEGNIAVAQHLDRVLHLFSFWIHFKDGKLISSDDKIIQILIELCGKCCLPVFCLKSVVEIVSSAIISNCLLLPFDKINIMVKQIYSHSKEVFFHFTRKILKYGMFEKDILPHLLSACLKLIQLGDYERKQTFQILAETIVSLKPAITCGDDIKSFTRLYFCLPEKSLMKNLDSVPSCNILENFLLQTLQIDNILDSELSNVWSALVCLPHLRYLNADVSNVLQNLAVNVHKHLLSESVHGHIRIEEYSFILCQLYFTYLILCKDTENDCFSIIFFTQLLKKHPKCVSILRLADLYFNRIKKSLNLDVLLDILPKIGPNLASPFHLVRLFTLKILNVFSSCIGEDSEDPSIFTICLESEKVPLDVQSYRGKLRWLRKLEYQFLEKQFSTECGEYLKKMSVYYLIGMLFVNFRLLWEPVIDILKTYAYSATACFWDVFGNYLNDVTEMCEKNDFQFMELWELDDSEVEHSVFHKCLVQFCKSSENPDIGNHRILLWKAMENFPDIVEPKNKIVVPLVFKLMVNEVTKIDDSMASKESISKDSNIENLISTAEMFDDIDTENEAKGYKRKQKLSFVGSKKRKCSTSINTSTGITSQIENEDVDGSDSEDSDRDDQLESDADISNNELDEELEELNDTKNVSTLSKKKSWTKRKYSVAKTLAAYLAVFSKFKNPKAVYKTEDLLKLYNELLSYHDPLIQKLSFDCIVTYGFKYLTPYKENFYRILDNKTFKSEVVLFSLDKQNEVIQEQHRMDVLAVLMRILYGKMLHKTGNNTTGKSQANTRRSLVLRFLAGCSANELKMFFELVFMPFQQLLKEDALIAVKKIRNSLDLSNIVPLRRQHSALNTLGLILQHLGNLIPELLPWLLKVLLVITATSTTLLEKRDEVLPHCVNLLKSVRTLAVMKLIQFFKSFPKYDFHPEEIDAVFESIVWPMLPRLEFESVNQPSPLLRLLSTWSENTRYFVFFSKHHESSELLNPLQHLIALYSSFRAKPRVLGTISKIIFQLLTAEEAEDMKDSNVAPLQINHSLCLPTIIEEDKEIITYGTKLLLSFVDSILQRLETTILTITKKKSKNLLSSRDLTILLKISCYIENSEQSNKLINLLVPFLHKPKIDSESEILILTTISNLMRKVKDPDKFIKLFAPLFGKLTNQNSRGALTNVFTTMAELKKDLSKIAVIINKVNAFDPNMMEEPNYQQRLDGHKEALEVIQSMSKTTVDENFIRIIIFNSTFMIQKLDDMALRNSSSHLLQGLIKVIATLQKSEPDIFNLLVFDTLLPEVHKGLKCSSEIKRHEFIGILSTVLKHCKNQSRLKELVSLCHDDQDLDFWENIRHLQVHRRARALLRFSNTLKNQCENKEKISTSYLLTYIIPIVQSFLFDDAYKKHIHVIDAAIETLGTITGALPWHHYELLLKQYLDLILKDAEHHKTIIKIIVSILNAFPYNLKEPKNFEASENNIGLVEMEGTQKNEDSAEKKSNLSNLQNMSNFNELTPELSMKINNAIRKNILPLLHRSLMKKSKRDDEHKLAGHYYPEDEEILRVPIALAMVKLLQKLPSGTLEKALPGLFLKMCELLKSRTESIRETTRETLIKMMQSLGPKYFYFLLKEMKGVMRKGYQIHVMIFTINAVLTNIANQLASGDLDESMKDLTEICMNELFSDVAEEKEVVKITGKLKEARFAKSFSIFQVISKYISEMLLLDLILPLKEVLFTKHSHKSMKKISECFRHIALGLSENKGLSEKGLLIFIHAIASESIPSLNPKKNKVESQLSKYERPDIFLVPKEPGRSGPPAKINEKTNIHILVEFGLQILQFCLKKDKVSKGDKEILEMLDPFVSLLSQCLSSNHIKVITTALRCLLPFYKYPLPSFKELTKKVVNSLFILINKYAAPGMGQGDNFEMIVMCFKMLTMLVRDTNYHKFNEDQLHSLLSYVEQDIYDYTRQATAFSLLKAILFKKMESSELSGIMSKIAEMSITSEQENVRSQCRQLCMQYMLDYPLGKKIKKSISFFLAQLEYSYEHGRVSCMEIINSMITMFPEDVLQSQAALFLVPLSARLVNDESARCRKMSAQCIKKLLEKVDHAGRTGLFSIALNWLKSKKMSHKRLGAQLCGLFAEVEGEQFEHHLLEILPSYTELIKDAANAEVEKGTDERCTDHFLYHLLNSLTKMLSFCSVIRKPQYSKAFNEFWEQLQGIILYPHMWVRLAAGQLFGLLLSSYSVDQILKAVLCEDTDVYINSKQKLRDLSADFSTQIQSLYLNDALGEQVVRNLVYLARVISALPECPESGENIEVTLSWMIRKMCREAKKEVAEAPNQSLRRKYVFMFIAAVTHELGKEKLLPFLSIILVPLCREITDASANADEDLKKNSQEVLDLIKTIVGVEDFSSNYAMVQSTLLKKKIKRKREKAQEAVTNPERYAKRKIKKQISKKESKKRKILKQKGKKKTKKAKLADIVITS